MGLTKKEQDELDQLEAEKAAEDLAPAAVPSPAEALRPAAAPAPDRAPGLLDLLRAGPRAANEGLSRAREERPATYMSSAAPLSAVQRAANTVMGGLRTGRDFARGLVKVPLNVVAGLESIPLNLGGAAYDALINPEEKAVAGSRLLSRRPDLKAESGSDELGSSGLQAAALAAPVLFPPAAPAVGGLFGLMALKSAYDKATSPVPMQSGGGTTMGYASPGAEEYGGAVGDASLGAALTRAAVKGVQSAGYTGNSIQPGEKLYAPVAPKEAPPILPPRDALAFAGPATSGTPLPREALAPGFDSALTNIRLRTARHNAGMKLLQYLRQGILDAKAEAPGAMAPLPQLSDYVPGGRAPSPGLPRAGAGQSVLDAWLARSQPLAPEVTNPTAGTGAAALERPTPPAVEAALAEANKVEASKAYPDRYSPYQTVPPGVPPEPGAPPERFSPYQLPKRTYGAEAGANPEYPFPGTDPAIPAPTVNPADVAAAKKAMAERLLARKTARAEAAPTKKSPLDAFREREAANAPRQRLEKPLPGKKAVEPPSPFPEAPAKGPEPTKTPPEAPERSRGEKALDAFRPKKAEPRDSVDLSQSLQPPEKSPGKKDVLPGKDLKGAGDKTRFKPGKSQDAQEGASPLPKRKKRDKTGFAKNREK